MAIRRRGPEFLLARGHGTASAVGQEIRSVGSHLVAPLILGLSRRCKGRPIYDHAIVGCGHDRRGTAVGDGVISRVTVTAVTVGHSVRRRGLLLLLAVKAAIAVLLFADPNGGEDRPGTVTAGPAFPQQEHYHHRHHDPCHNGKGPHDPSDLATLQRGNTTDEITNLKRDIICYNMYQIVIVLSR